MSNEYLSSSTEVVLRSARVEDAIKVNRLVAKNPPLDPNSLYCNLLQCSHFSDTSVVCEYDGELVSFMTAYRKPSCQDELFIWQMAVAEQCRGRGLAARMLNYLVDKLHPTFIETTITEDNIASATAFQRFVQKRKTQLSKSTLFDCDRHFDGLHDSELLYRIGPIF